jgi:hypothetical protein
LCYRKCFETHPEQASNWVPESKIARAKSMRSMKILQVNKRYYPHIGGMERYLYWLCNELLRYPDVTLTVLVCNNSLKTEVEDYDRFKLVRVASPAAF